MAIAALLKIKTSVQTLESHCWVEHAKVSRIWPDFKTVDQILVPMMYSETF